MLINNFISISRFRLLSGLFIFLLTGLQALFADPRPSLGIRHEEFSDPPLTVGVDALVWVGKADRWLVLRSINDQGFATVGSTNGRGLIGATFNVPVVVGPGSTVSYIVTGGEASSNVASATQFLEDPGFNAGPNTTKWTQTLSNSGGVFNTNYIDGSPGNYTAYLGGGPSETDVISTTVDIPLPVPAVSGVPLPTKAELSLRYVVKVTSLEDPEDETPWDTLTLQIYDVNTGEILQDEVVADSYHLRGRTLFRSATLDYDVVQGKSLGIIFRSSNDEILQTVFAISHVQLNLNTETALPE